MHAIPPAPTQPHDRGRRTFVKVSGRLAASLDAATWVAALAKDRLILPSPTPRPNGLLVVVGGGEKVNEALRAAGLPESVGGRELERREQRMIAERELSETCGSFRRLVRDMIGSNLSGLQFRPPAIEVDFPFVGNLEIPLSGDEMVRAVYGSFDDLFVLTAEDRHPRKEAFFAEFPRVTVLPFPLLA